LAEHHPGGVSRIGRKDDAAQKSEAYNERMNAFREALNRIGLDPLDALTAAALFVGLAVAGIGTPALLVCAALVALPLGWRRRRPLLIYALVLVGVVAGMGLEAWPRVAALVIATYTLGSSRHSLWLTLAAILIPATLALIIFGGELPPLPNLAGPYMVIGIPWLVGYAIAQQRRKAEISQDRAARLEREQAQAMHAAVAQERARIARELHDVVAHHVSVMVIQAGAARQVLPGAPERAIAALRTVEDTGREALNEMRHIVCLLSPDGSQLGLAPQPGLAQLEALVDRVRQAGLPVSMRVEGQARPLPGGLDLAAYRIVQEALTNALKYARQAQTDVLIWYSETGLTVEVQNEGGNRPASAGGSTGHGLVGMRERAALYGGTVEASRRPDNGYRVRIWLPDASH
jgi:signal transduction histidine kinase